MSPESPDIKIPLETPTRAPSAIPIDDAVLPFEVATLDLRGRLTRLGPALDDILTKHDYPAPVGKLLGEAIVLTTLLGSSLKFDGRFILQTQTDGPVSFMIVDFQAPDRLRAYARFDAKRLESGQDSGALLGKGHLAMTVDQGPDMSRYQGLVPLEGESSHSLSFWYPRHNLLHWWGNVDRCCQLQTAIFDQVDGTGSPLVLTKELLQPLF